MKSCPFAECQYQARKGCRLFPGKSIQQCHRYADGLITKRKNGAIARITPSETHHTHETKNKNHLFNH